jgi:hypothetical protein
MKGENGDFMENVFTSEKKLGFGLMRLPLLNPNDGYICIIYALYYKFHYKFPLKIF